MANQTWHDAEIKKTPREWFEAEAESPSDESGEWAESRVAMAVVPSGLRGSPFSIIGSATVGAFVGANAWYWSELSDLIRSPWVAVPLGAFIALTTRIGGGGRDTGFRAGTAVAIYFVALTGVLMGLTYNALIDVYGYVESYAQFEQSLLRARLQQSEHLVAYVIGAAAAWILSVLLRQR